MIENPQWGMRERTMNMIEFLGYLTDEAEQYYWKKSRRLGRNIMWCSMLLLSPAIISFSVNLREWSILIAYGALFCFIPVLCLIPKGKKEKKSLTPNKVRIEDGYIMAFGEKFEECRSIQDAKQVKDHGDFYEITFPFGKISDKFICQKSLLSQGTLEEFEQLFQGKIK